MPPRKYIVRIFVVGIAGVGFGIVGVWILLYQDKIWWRGWWFLFLGALAVFSTIAQGVSLFAKGRLILNRLLVVDVENEFVEFGPLETPCSVWIFFESSQAYYFGKIVVSAKAGEREFAETVQLARLDPSSRTFGARTLEPVSVMVPKIGDRSNLTIAFHLAVNFAAVQFFKTDRPGEEALTIWVRSMD